MLVVKLLPAKPNIFATKTLFAPSKNCSNAHTIDRMKGTLTMRASAHRGNGPHRFPMHAPAELTDPLLAEWAEWQRAANRAEATIVKRVGTVNRFAINSGVSCVSACHTDIRAWFAKNRHWAPGTAAGNFDSLNGWFVWLQRMEYRADNPMLKLDKPKRKPNPPRPANDGDLVRMLASSRHQKTRVMILLAALAGLRVHEVAKVAGEDIDGAGGVLWVLGKGEKLRSVPLHPLLVSAAQTMPARGYWFPSNARVTAAGKRLPVSPAAVTITIGRAMRRAGAAGTPHTLRHWFGSSLHRQGADLLTIKALMRHESVAATQIYVKVSDELQRDAVATLDPWAGARAQLFKRA